MTDQPKDKVEIDWRSLLTRARHRDVFEWLLKKYNCTPEQLIGRLMIDGVMKSMAEYREDHGGGGASSKNIEHLTNKLKD